MTPSKDTLELGNLSGEPAGAQGSVRPKQGSGQLRSEAVSLEVPVKVHGSRVTEVVRGITPHTEPFEEQSSTMIVFPQGCVLKMSATLSTGQMVVITNLKSGQDAICRVVKVRPHGNAHSYVEIEFTQRQPGYWGVYFASDGPELAKRVAPAAAAQAAPVASPLAATPVAPARPVQAPEQKAPPAPKAPAMNHSDANTTTAPAKPVDTPLERHAQQKLSESQFASFGSKEEVQPAASATNAAKPLPFVEYEKRDRAAEADRRRAASNLPAAPPAIGSPSVSIDDLRGDTQVAPVVPSPEDAPSENVEVSTSIAPEPSPVQLSVNLERIAPSSGLAAARPAPREMFGVRLDSTIGQVAEGREEKGRNWILIAACIAALVAAIGGGTYYYFYGRTVAISFPNSISATPTPPVALEADKNSVSEPAIPSENSVATPVAPLGTVNPPRAMASERAMLSRAPEAGPSKLAKASPVVESNPSAPVEQKNPSAIPDMSGALNAHPASSRPVGTRQLAAPPSLDTRAVSGNANGAIPGMGASSGNLSVPAPPAPQAPLRVGGNIKPPHMISSVLPAYPSIARQAGVQGNVVIDTVVDKAGNVASMKVVSGPQMLRQPALDALRQWKYEPSRLNGQPVSVQMIVTIQFHR
jgi:TonB family protein